MIRTGMTEMFGIQHPIMLAGMNWISTPQLVAPVSNAGGLGTLAIARYSPEETIGKAQVSIYILIDPFPFLVYIIFCSSSAVFQK